MPLRMRRQAGMLLETGQITAYSVGDDGDLEFGLGKRYTVFTVGPHSGTVNLDVPHYASNGISFTAAGNIVADTAAGLATVLTADTVVIKGSALNDGVYTVAAGGVAGQFTTVEALVNEVAGAYVKIYKRVAHSNNGVWDRQTGLIWVRYTSNGEKVGPASTGTLNWYSAATCFTLHGAAADLQMIAPNTLRIVGGAGEIARYDVGDTIVCSGFANAANNLPNYYVVSVTVNGADLDIVVRPNNNVLVSEAAGGARDIKLVCQGIYGYAAAANAAELAGYDDWRVPNCTEIASLASSEQPSGVPDSTAFPSWPTSETWSSTTRPENNSQAYAADFDGEAIGFRRAKTNTYFCALVRGGTTNE